MEYHLPDGTILNLDHSVLSVPEVLFRDTADGHGIHQLVSSCINSVDADIRRELYGGLVVTGGTSLLPGFAEGLQRNVNVPSVCCLIFVVNAVSRYTNLKSLRPQSRPRGGSAVGLEVVFWAH